MSPAGKIINIDAFKKKESGLISSKENMAKGATGKRSGAGVAVAVSLAAVAALTFLMTPPRKTTVPSLPVGSIAPYNIKSPEDMLVEDKESTEKNRRQARDAVLDVYDFDSEAEQAVTAKLSEAFALAAKTYKGHVEQAYTDALKDFKLSLQIDAGEGAAVSQEERERLKKRASDAKGAITSFETSEAFANLEKEFQAKLGVELDEKLVKTLRYYYYWPWIGDRVASILSPIFARGVVAQKSQLPASSSNGVVMNVLSTGMERVVQSLGSFHDIPETQRMVHEEAAVIVPGGRPGLRRLVEHLGTLMITPNMSFNRKETDQRKALASETVKPVFFKVQRGEMIIREGERVIPAHAAKLDYLAGKVKDRGRLATFAGTTLFNLLLVTIAFVFVRKYHAEVRDTPKLQVLLAFLLVGHMSAIWAAVYVFTIFMPQTSGIPLQTYLFAAPLAFGPMIASIFFTTELTVLFTILVSALTGLLLRDFPILALLTITSGMVCAYNVRHYHKRSSVIKVGLLVAVVNILVVLAFDALGAKPLSGELWNKIAFAFLGGALAAVLVSAALPIIESLFPVVSDIKLLELSNLNHPLLRRMIMEAPGSYHHSMMVGNLAEEACKSIGANALLARAGALFHDIGKMKKPDYFVENQRHGVNPHDKLTPSMSALIVINHIKDGLELAKQYKLLPQISTMIPEHHGTQLVRVFYSKAKSAEDASRDEVREEDYRYPGPIPGSPESACVALADSIEAAARACPNPTPQRIRDLVTDVINDKFIQGQLDNSNLTLHDLALVADSYIHALTGIHHHRLEYPDEKKEQAKAHAGPDSQAQRASDTERI